MINERKKKQGQFFTKKRVMLYVDVLLMLLIILLLSPRITGLGLHEILGFILFIPVIVHLLFSWTWISQSTKRLFAGANKHTRFNYFLTAVLFILIVLEIVSGIVISQVALPAFGIHTIYDSAWRMAHNMMLNWIKLCVGIHTAANWKVILSALKNLIPENPLSKNKRSRFIIYLGINMWRIGLIILAALVISVLIYGIIGPSSALRLYNENVIARFRARLVPGILQFTGQTLLIALVIYLSLKWLKVRL